MRQISSAFLLNNRPGPLMPNSKTSSIQLLQRGELPLLHIENPHASAVIALQGAHILAYTPKGEAPLLWLSERTEFKRGQSPRGGIPICWPWFGDPARNPDALQKMLAEHTTAGEKTLAHGFVRTLDWQIYSVTESDESTDIILRYSTATSLAPAIWPHAAQLQLTINVGPKLRISLTTQNLDSKPLAITQALHTYFAISDIAQVTTLGFDGCRYIDTLDDWREHRQPGDIRFTAETDRIYLDAPTQVQLRDDGWQRTIYLQAQNSASTVVWNPWIEKSLRLSQFAADAWQRMVCIETANVLNDMLVLPPRAEHSLELELWAEPD
jgi:glucose-6-phosphate 1-epimerase